MAWLLSDRHLEGAELDAVSRRIAEGEAIRPSRKQLARAKTALGRAWATDPGLTVAERLGLLACSIVLTPMVGLVAWFWWRESHPRASIQALALSLPFSLIFLVGWQVWVWVT